MRRIAMGMTLAAGMAGGLVPALARADDRCLEDGRALEGWHVADSRSGGSYLILEKELEKKPPQRRHFYLCRIDGEVRQFVRELGIEADAATTHVEATLCTPLDSGVPGTGYLSVLDNRTSRLLALYRFDALEEDVEKMAPDSAVCSAPSN